MLIPSLVPIHKIPDVSLKILFIPVLKILLGLLRFVVILFTSFVFGLIIFNPETPPPPSHKKLLLSSHIPCIQPTLIPLLLNQLLVLYPIL